MTEQNDDLNAQGDALCDHRYERKQNLALAEQTRALLAETARQTAATT